MYVAKSPLDMCAVGGFVRRGARSNVWRVTTFPASIGHIDVKMSVVRPIWCPQLTNEHIVRFYLFIKFISNKTKYSLYGPYAKDTNTYVYI